MDAKAGVVGVGAGAEVEEELYTAPIYNEPAPVNNTWYDNHTYILRRLMWKWLKWNIHMLNTVHNVVV